MSKGFIPDEFKSPANRARIENVNPQTFIGFVSRLSELKNNSLTKGNATNKGRLLYTCADTEDFAISSGFINKKAASVAIVEKLHETGIIDERSPSRYENDCSFTVEYPYSKTEAGALQLAKMPWDCKTEAKTYLFGGLMSLIFGASIF
eukprot:GHVR01000961.1.p1 GENE.GHVR01000961.1~~GHVR01000961.1.p1  ORF type:complete len:149 (-),score=5.29 GHVR01000961.1:354-800(-)